MAGHRGETGMNARILARATESKEFWNTDCFTCLCVIFCNLPNPHVLALVITSACTI